VRLSTDLRQFIESLNSHAVEYLIVGAYALAYHGSPRYTGDVDILIRQSAENAARVEDAIRQFGFGSLGLGAADFQEPYQVIQLGHPPNRIDLLTGLSGVSFEEAWEGRAAGKLDGVPVQFIGRQTFVKNKRASGRLKDRADLEALGEA
jgi:predicted nucleotidyltransferase